MKLVMIILAAGNSRRFGRNKLLYEIEGVPMYRWVLEELQGAVQMLEQQMSEVTCECTIVTQYQEIKEYGEAHGMQTLINPHPEKGIASSLKIGLEANVNADAALFAVADQPWLKKATIVGLTEKLLNTDKKIVCPAVMEDGKVRLGNPCYFSKEYFTELLGLTGDVGGKQVVKKHMEDTDLLFLEEEKELTDIDYQGGIEQ